MGCGIVMSRKGGENKRTTAWMWLYYFVSRFCYKRRRFVWTIRVLSACSNGNAFFFSLFCPEVIIILWSTLWMIKLNRTMTRWKWSRSWWWVTRPAWSVNRVCQSVWVVCVCSAHGYTSSRRSGGCVKWTWNGHESFMVIICELSSPVQNSDWRSQWW